MLTAIVIVVLLAVRAAVFFGGRSALALIPSLIEPRLRELDDRLDRRLHELDVKVDGRLKDATETSERIHERLGEVGNATKEMLNRAKDLGRLEQALRPPKARGGFGELLLENLLRDRLPPSAYSVQHTFAGGERVDAVVRVGQLIPVDSKFPLDNYHRIVEAESDVERLRQNRGASPVRARQARLPRVADDLHRVPAGDRAGHARDADRAARARGDGIRSEERV